MHEQAGYLGADYLASILGTLEWSENNLADVGIKT